MISTFIEYLAPLSSYFWSATAKMHNELPLLLQQKLSLVVKLRTKDLLILLKLQARLMSGHSEENNDLSK